MAENQTHTFQVRATDAVGHVDATPASHSWLIQGDSVAPNGTSVVINSSATYAVVLDEVSVRLNATDNRGVTAYLITEHNATDPSNVIPPYLDPLPADSGWVSVAETSSFTTLLTHTLTQAYAMGDTVEICAWFMDAKANISTRLCDTIIYGVTWESSWGSWYPDNGVWQVGAPTVGPAACYEGTQCAGTQLDGNYARYQSSRLIGGRMELPTAATGEELQLSFWHWYSYSAYDFGSMQIQVWDAVTQTWGAWEPIGNNFTGTSMGWTRTVIDVSSYGGETVRLGLYHYATSNCGSCANEGAGWYIDNLQIAAVVPSFAGNFETGWSDWYTTLGVWQVGTPTTGPGACYEGTQCAGTQLDGNYTRYQSSRLVGGTMELPTVGPGQLLQMRFWHWYSYSAYDLGQMQIQVWDAVTQTWDVWAPIGTNFTGVSLSWVPGVIDITSYAGMTVRFGLYHYATSNCGSCANEGAGWYVDDMSVQVF